MDKQIYLVDSDIVINFFNGVFKEAGGEGAAGLTLKQDENAAGAALRDFLDSLTKHYDVRMPDAVVVELTRNNKY